MGLNVFEIFAKIGLDTSEYDKDIDKSREKASGFASSLKKGFGIAAKSVGVLTTATVALGAGFVKATGDVATYGDNIDKMSQKMGMSAEAYQEWDAVMQHSGTSMETLKASMKTLANAAETGNDAFNKLGITQEQIANMSQEELFSATITALQNIDDETQRTYLAGQTLGRGATELGALLNTSAEDTQAMKDRVHELGGVMSDEAVKAAAAYQDSLQDMQTALTGLKNNLVSEMLPAVTTVMDGLGNVFSGDYETGTVQIEEGIDNLISKIKDIIPKAMKIGGSILESLGQSILQSLPKLSQTALEIILQLVQGIVEQLPTIADTASQILQVLITGITQALPTLIPAAVQAIITLVQTLISPDSLTLIINAALQLIMGLAQGIIEALPILIEALPEIIRTIVTVLLDSIPTILETAGHLIEALTTGLIDAIPMLIGMLPQITMAIAAALIKAAPDLLVAAVELITQLSFGLIKNIPILLLAIPEIILEIIKGLAQGGADMFTAGEDLLISVKDGFFSLIDNAVDWGKDLIDNFIGGIKEKAGSVVDTVEDIAGDIADFIGFSEPEKGPLSNFHTFAPDMMDLFMKGVKDNEDTLRKQISSTFDIESNIKESAYIEPQGAPMGGVPLGYGSLQSTSERQPIYLQVGEEVFAKLVYNANIREGERVGVNLTEAVRV